MKKIISLLLSIIIVFSATCYSANADEERCEYVDYPCYKYFVIRNFTEDNYIEELSENVGSIEFSEYSVTVTAENIGEQMKVYLSINGDNYLKLLKAVIAVRENANAYEFIGYVGCSSNDENIKNTATVKLSFLDENFETKESKSIKDTSGGIFASEMSLTPVTAKYLCATIKFSDDSSADAKVNFGSFVFAWFGEHQMETTEKETAGHMHYINDCTVCNFIFGGNQDIMNMPYHEKVEVPEVAASCSQTGLSAGVKCKNCGVFIEPQTEIPKIEHTPSDEWVETIPATYDAEGEKVKKCTVCGEVVQTEIIPKLEKPIETTPPTTTQPATTKPVETTQPTTTEPTIQNPVETTTTTQPITTVTTTTACLHDKTETDVDDIKKATYFADGHTGNSYCMYCSALVYKSKVIKKLTLKVPKFKLTKGKQQFKVKYTKVKDATGFQVRYKIKGKWKTKTFSSKKSVTKVISKLKKGKYTVQVRAMIKQGKNKAFSTWSKAQKVKVK